jgi:hypothetical protein
LRLQTTAGDVRQLRPVIYQEVDGVKQEIAGHYVLKGRHEVGFKVAQYDKSRPLIIDPVLAYSTFVGGNNSDQSDAIAVDADGNAYITGQTTSANDGDGRTDISVWQSDSGKWHIINSADNLARLQIWGQSALGDLAAPGDYDGDGKTDLAVWRPDQGTWYVIQSSTNSGLQRYLGNSADTPIPAAHLPQ